MTVTTTGRLGTSADIDVVMITCSVCGPVSPVASQEKVTGQVPSATAGQAWSGTPGTARLSTCSCIVAGASPDERSTVPPAVTVTTPITVSASIGAVMVAVGGTGSALAVDTGESSPAISANTAIADTLETRMTSLPDHASPARYCPH